MKTLQRESVEDVIDQITQDVRDEATGAARAPADEAAAAALDAALAEIPREDYEILREWKETGLRYGEIAKKKGMTDEAVLRSLSRTYAHLRMRTIQ